MCVLVCWYFIISDYTVALQRNLGSSFTLYDVRTMSYIVQYGTQWYLARVPIPSNGASSDPTSLTIK